MTEDVLRLLARLEGSPGEDVIDATMLRQHGDRKALHQVRAVDQHQRQAHLPNQQECRNISQRGNRIQEDALGLLGEGLGYLVAVAPNTELTACQQAAERAARSANLGVWKRSPVLSLDRLAQSGFAVVRGRVLEVERNRGGIWLEMDGPLVLRIEPKVLKAFDAKRVMQMAGRSLEVRGWVVDRSRRGAVPAGKARWQMSVTDPAMLEWLP